MFLLIVLSLLLWQIRAWLQVIAKARRVGFIGG
ncbi:Uncharacterised protein [Aeromonas salmonicida]|uniref:Uncharacterized protein n=1 Tax=Aeromonas salmonicida subsp. salmonicida 01-B526 TaxID=1076135 RepID=A0ABN0E2U6_AERSS|nr:hypothetical protein IYQ_06133 [Aeromonas salmonicida subsp. salmonicida 01-B526]SPT73144.1 Uncharacterised protein [Aeromonas salmonicida]VFB11721.1 Uncharacterised protein [Aeromonas salmonicida]